MGSLGIGCSRALWWGEPHGGESRSPKTPQWLRAAFWAEGWAPEAEFTGVLDDMGKGGATGFRAG